MPKRQDIRTILIIGSGPIVIGQGCEFDYSGVQACKSLRDEGYRIVLVNSNPATIMTDPGFSDRTYIEPITPESVVKIIEKERARGEPIDALLPTLGGQTALNCACRLWDSGELQRLGVEMIGASREVIHRAEDRQAFKLVCESVGLKAPHSRVVETLEDARAFLDEVGLPAIIRPAFTLGGAGGGVAYNSAEFDEIVTRGLRASMIGQVQVDQSLLGWKEYELEVVRDRKDNCIIVCGIENIDPMGVHTGDSITVAPILTLTDKEYQRLRDGAIAIMRAVGVETGGSNVQFAVNPADGEVAVVEMNPRVSRSSALASKATGFPIAKIAAKLAVGYTLDELRNDITGTTSACFEPTIDYIVTKMPRWTFEKFPEADETLTTQMKSVGEAMAIGRTFKESLQKAIRSMEVKRFGLGLDRNDKWLAHKRREEAGLPGEPDEPWPVDEEKLTRKLAVPSQGRLYYVRYAFKLGLSLERIHELTRIDPFFLDEIKQLVEFEDVLCEHEALEDLPRETLLEAKRLGYSDAQLAHLYLGEISADSILRVRRHRQSLGIECVYKLVDTCAAEFEAITPYYYSTYEAGYAADSSSKSPATTEDEIRITDRKKVIILGGGPNRIGQGIEFDYCCVHAAFAARKENFESVMINSNPETVSTDYDTSDLLFFEPLTLEDTLNVIERLHGAPLGEPGHIHGAIVQFGGQTPLNLAAGLVKAGAPIIGTSLDSIDLAEDRERFRGLLEKLGLEQPPSGIAYSMEQALEIAERVGYPVLVRPSYVLGGRGMEICPDERAMRQYMAKAVDVSELDKAPVLVDKFLDEATEVDVDVVADFVPLGAGAAKDGGRRALVCGVMEHIQQAGIHSGDSSCTIPPRSLPRPLVEQIRAIARTLAEGLRVNGLMNVQMAVKNDQIYILEVNPRASRTAPFVSKAKGIAWPLVAARVMMGRTLAELGIEERPDTGYYSVKESVFPFDKFPRVDFVLGPEMRSTGEVMGIDPSLPIALAKAEMASGTKLPMSGNVFLSVREIDKPHIVETARALASMGFGLYTTRGTAEYLARHSVKTTPLKKIAEGARPNVADMLTSGEIHLVINTPTRTGFATDEGKIRATAVRLGVPMMTTATGAEAMVRAIQALRAGDWTPFALQDYEEMAKEAAGRAAPASV
ncbi:MAG: carbamoyl-phosphate synthase large subunit [Phycisphaeraceae bacterium]|nr:MAG: carbamoyl-phosphate synthase large subunit [Phycisphaeraceae bacterium]